MKSIRRYLLYLGYREHYNDPFVIRKAHAIESTFLNSKKTVKPHHLVAGSLSCLFSSEISDADLDMADEVIQNFEHHAFINNFDHFAGCYDTFLKDGIAGTLAKIEKSISKYKNDKKKYNFLKAAKITMQAFSKMCVQYAKAANNVGHHELAQVCKNVSMSPPKTFREALQLIWFCYQAFLYEGRHAMALGRMDQYLYPYYKNDIQQGTLTKEFACDLLCDTFLRITGKYTYYGFDDVVNICIGGVDKNGDDATNELSYIILNAVKKANVPGPNLSARIHKNTSKEFFMACMDVIGTGIGYPALMNDEINIPALLRAGYSLEHVRDYCMVGCIENFMGGLQPPWSDGRFNTPKYLEAALNNGRCLLTNKLVGIEGLSIDNVKTMDEFLKIVEEQIEFGTQEYMAIFKSRNRRYNSELMVQPFLSCFCHDCIDRGLDINGGGALYPSVHGVACMGISTIADSLAAIEELVFKQKKYTLDEIRKALKADFKGFEEIRYDMVYAPKYGNNDDFVDKYAVWFIDFLYSVFEKYRTHDGGRIYIAIAANVQNVSAGAQTGATPDGRHAKAPLSDAASPTYGMDKNGPTAVVLSCTKPDYTKAICGTVLNQKFSQSFFTNPEKREQLYILIKTYFDMGGQQIQINSVSDKVLKDAMENPEKYKSLIVRVSGFSAYYTTLERNVQEDILMRTAND